MVILLARQVCSDDEAWCIRVVFLENHVQLNQMKGNVIIQISRDPHVRLSLQQISS
jgi:hypothetical protein